jgi:hypothetical protein
MSLFPKVAKNQQSELIIFSLYEVNFLYKAKELKKVMSSIEKSIVFYALMQRFISIRKGVSCWYILSTPAILLL